MINNTLKENVKIGLLTGNNDWDYIYFGKNFKRNIRYINSNEYKKINNLFLTKNLDAAVVNTKFFPELYKQLFTNPIFQISGNDFYKYFKPVNDCKFIIRDDNLCIQVSGDDPYFENINELNLSRYKSVLISIDLYSSKETELQIFYRNKNESYNENKSQKYKIINKDQTINFIINNPENIKYIRIDPTNIKNDIIIKEIDFLGVNE